MQRAQLLLEEYRQVNENMRHYANMRFKQLTLFNAMNAGLVIGFITVTMRNEPVAGNLQLIFKILGIILVAIFTMIGERISDYWHRFRKRAQKIESVLQLQQHRNAPVGKWFTAANATRTLYVVFLGFWTCLLIRTYFKDLLWFVIWFLTMITFYLLLQHRLKWVQKKYPIS